MRMREERGAGAFGSGQHSGARARFASAHCATPQNEVWMQRARYLSDWKKGCCHREKWVVRFYGCAAS